nr:hypothetical protein [Piscicoccus intestinalis]
MRDSADRSLPMLRTMRISVIGASPAGEYCRRTAAVVISSSSGASSHVAVIATTATSVSRPLAPARNMASARSSANPMTSLIGYCSGGGCGTSPEYSEPRSSVRMSRFCAAVVMRGAPSMSGNDEVVGGPSSRAPV